MSSVSRRVGAGCTALLVLFLAVVTVQLIVGDRLQEQRVRHLTQAGRAKAANLAVLQHMTDAETGVRGFQLTGEPLFLEPYQSGRGAAFTALDDAQGVVGDPAVLRVLGAEREAAVHWLDAYAIPIVLAGRADADEDKAALGKQMFDEFRAANAAAGAAIAAHSSAVAATDRHRARLAQLLFAALDVAFVGVLLVLFALGRRLLLAPLENIRRTLRRLAAGDRSARAEVAGPHEMRVVIGTLNELAAQTERLFEAEHARSVRNELRQAVAAQLRTGLDGDTVTRIAGLLGSTLRADVVHIRLCVAPGDTVTVCRPSTAPALPGLVDAQVAEQAPGTVVPVPGDAGAVVLALGAEAGGCPGLVHLARHAGPDWQAAELTLLASIGREIDHAARQARLQHRQARLIAQLRDLDERKDAFVATVTHELRTPLTSIVGYTEMLADGDGGELTALQQRGVQAILRNAERLQETVGDLLLLDRTDSRADGPFVPVDLGAVVAAVAADAEPAARAKGVALTGAAGHAWVSGDAGRLVRAVQKLLENAVKFTEPGGTISYEVQAGARGAVLSVTDTGIGIPAEDLPGLGTPFHRGANAMAQAVQGSGLGLAIVRMIVTEHGGALAVESDLGRGSTFQISLPRIDPPAPDAVDGGQDSVPALPSH